MLLVEAKRIYEQDGVCCIVDGDASLVKLIDEFVVNSHDDLTDTWLLAYDC